MKKGCFCFWGEWEISIYRYTTFNKRTKSKSNTSFRSNFNNYTIFSLGKEFPQYLGVILLENTQQPISLVVNADTGEIEKELFPGYRIVAKKQIEYNEKNREEIESDRMYYFGQDNKFSMLSSYSARQLADEKLTATEYRVVLLMISNTNYKSGLITIGNNHSMDAKWISNALKINIKTAESCLKTLTDRGIIAQNTTNFKTKYFFNPYIQYRGRWINRTLYEMFKNTRWAKSDNK